MKEITCAKLIESTSPFITLLVLIVIIFIPVIKKIFPNFNFEDYVGEAIPFVILAMINPLVKAYNTIFYFRKEVHDKPIEESTDEHLS